MSHLLFSNVRRNETAKYRASKGCFACFIQHALRACIWKWICKSCLLFPNQGKVRPRVGSGHAALNTILMPVCFFFTSIVQSRTCKVSDPSTEPTIYTPSLPLQFRTNLVGGSDLGFRVQVRVCAAELVTGAATAPDGIVSRALLSACSLFRPQFSQ